MATELHRDEIPRRSSVIPARCVDPSIHPKLQADKETLWSRVSAGSVGDSEIGRTAEKHGTHRSSGSRYLTAVLKSNDASDSCCVLQGKEDVQILVNQYVVLLRGGRAIRATSLRTLSSTVYGRESLYSNNPQSSER